MTKIRWGILSTSHFADRFTGPALQKGKHTTVLGVASRSLERAQEFARRHSIPKTYGSYEEMLADPEIDAVYNPMPNHLHVPWTIRALQAGKHVLCEKPIALTAGEAETLVQAAHSFPRLKVMEAFMYRFHPQWQAALRYVQEGRLGELRTIDTLFSYYLVDPANVRNQADIGGGGLLDIGCYPISLSRWIFGREPLRVAGRLVLDPVMKVDRLASALLDFGGGTATFTVGTQLDPFQRVNIVGDQGRFEIEIPFNAPSDRPCRAWFTQRGKVETLEFETCDQYTLEGDAFALAVINDTPVPTPLEDALANMAVIDAVVQSDREKSWVELPTR